MAISSWSTVAAVAVAYWTIAITSWIVRHRARARAQRPSTITPMPGGGVRIGLEGSLDLRVACAVLLGPPAFVVLLKVFAGS